MKYIILNSKISENEISSRKKYIEKVTRAYFLLNKTTEGIELVSFPSTLFDCVIIVGHNGDVKHYINTHQINEKNIVLVTCGISNIDEIMKDKNIYVSFDEEGKTRKYDGKQYNLNFEVTKEELLLLDTSDDLMETIRTTFRRV